jgi:hypothetical protein
LRLAGTGGNILRVSLTTALRYGRSFKLVHVMSLCDLNAPRISAVRRLYAFSLVRMRDIHAARAVAVVSLPAALV